MVFCAVELDEVAGLLVVDEDEAGLLVVVELELDVVGCLFVAWVDEAGLLAVWVVVAGLVVLD